MAGRAKAPKPMDCTRVLQGRDREELLQHCLQVQVLRRGVHARSRGCTRTSRGRASTSALARGTRVPKPLRLQLKLLWDSGMADREAKKKAKLAVAAAGMQAAGLAAAPGSPPALRAGP